MRGWLRLLELTIELGHIDPELFEIMTGEKMNRDVDLQEWLDGIGFKPANSEAKQLGHELARVLVGNTGSALHEVLPPGRDKSLAFTLLEDVLMRSNRALALGGGPVRQDDDAVASMRRAIEASPTVLPQDERIEEYKADQRRRGEELAASGDEDAPEPYWASSVAGSAGEPWALALDARPGRVSIATISNDPRNVADVCQEFLAGQPADPTGPFRGFVVNVESPEHLNAILHELSLAGERAFGPAESISESPF